MRLVLLLVLVAVARDAAALRTPLITAKLGGGEKRVAETFGPYEYLRTASLDECVAAAPFFCDQLQRPPLDDEIQQGLDAMLGSSNGARGFFLAWNTNAAFALADESPPPPALLSAVDQACRAPGPTSFFAKTLLMNIAMPAAAECALNRLPPASGAVGAVGEGAAMRSYRRAALLAGFISTCEVGDGAGGALPPALRAEATALAEAIAAQGTDCDADAKDQTWSGLLAGYDAEQLEAVAQAVRLSGPASAGE